MKIGDIVIFKDPLFLDALTDDKLMLILKIGDTDDIVRWPLTAAPWNLSLHYEYVPHHTVVREYNAYTFDVIDKDGKEMKCAWDSPSGATYIEVGNPDVRYDSSFQMWIEDGTIEQVLKWFKHHGPFEGHKLHILRIRTVDGKDLEQIDESMFLPNLTVVLAIDSLYSVACRAHHIIKISRNESD